MRYTATEMAKKLDISRSYLYYLKEAGVVEIEKNENGKPIWTESVYNQLFEYIKKNHRTEEADNTDRSSWCELAV